MTASSFRRAQRLDAIRTSPIIVLAQRAADLRQWGDDIIDLTLGEPDFDTPAEPKAAGCAAIHAGRTKYTPLRGEPELLQLIAKRTQKLHGRVTSPGEVIACAGAKQVIHNALAASLDRGDEVILPAPFWTSYADMVLLQEGIPLTPSSRWDAERGWRLDTEAVERAIGPRTRWLFLNSPSNPAGAVLGGEVLERLAAILRRHPQVWVLCDDIYEEIVYGAPPLRLLHLAPDLASRTLLVSGVSKAFAMTGWRLGWGVGPTPLIAAMASVQSQTTSAPSSVSQAAAAAALRSPSVDVDRMVAAFRSRRDLLVSEFARLPGIECPSPEGAFYLFPRLERLLSELSLRGGPASDEALCADLLEHAGVALVPGSVFGAPGYLRLSFAASEEALRIACNRIRTRIEALLAGNAAAAVGA